MINFTLTITAAPELLAAISDFTNSITSAKVVSIPESNSEITITTASKEHTAAYGQPAQIQVPVSEAPTYNQPNILPVNQVNIQTESKPIYPAQTYTMEQLAVATTQLVDAGRRTELLSLLSSFGVQALTALPKEQYGAFAAQLRALEAKI
jgi:hypothetical protein